jgi:hypothetical protein
VRDKLEQYNAKLDQIELPDAPDNTAGLDARLKEVLNTKAS